MKTATRHTIDSKNEETRKFETLFTQYHPKVYLFISGFIQDPEMARDLTQDLFFSLWTDRNRLSEVENLNAYIYRMAKNRVFNYFKQEYIHQRYCNEAAGQDEDPDNPEELYFARELQQLIDVVVAQMPPQRRLIYNMSRIEGLDNTEIAARLEISRRTVENHLTSALNDLRRIIGCLLLFF